MEGQQSPPSEHYVSHKVQRSHVRPPRPTPSGARQSWERGPGPWHLLHPGALFSALHPPCLDRTMREAGQCSGVVPSLPWAVFLC